MADERVSLEIGADVQQSEFDRAERAYSNVGDAAEQSAREIDSSTDKVIQAERRKRDAIEQTTQAYERQARGGSDAADRAGKAASITSTARGAIGDIGAGLVEGDIGALVQGLVDAQDTFGQLGEAAGQSGGKIGQLAGSLAGNPAALAAVSGGAAIAIGAAALAFKVLNDRAKEAAAAQKAYNDGLLAQADIIFEYEQGRATIEDVAQANRELNIEYERTQNRLETLKEEYREAEENLGVFGRTWRRLFNGGEAQLVRDIEELEDKSEDLTKQMDGAKEAIEDAGLTSEVATEHIRAETEARQEQQRQEREHQRIIEEVNRSTQQGLNVERELAMVRTQGTQAAQQELQVQAQLLQATQERIQVLANGDTLLRNGNRETTLRTGSPDIKRFQEGDSATVGGSFFTGFRNPFAIAARGT